MKKTPQVRGFSLVEVTIAIAILSFCLLILLALLPVGLTSTTDSLQKTSAAGIASQITADILATPLATSSKPVPPSARYGLVLDTTSASGTGSTNTFYLDDGGNPTSFGNSATFVPGAIYKATVVVSNPKVPASASGAAPYFPNQPTLVRIIVTWPAAAEKSAAAGTLPTKFLGSYETVTQVDRN